MSQMLNREQVAALLGWKVQTLNQALSRTRKAMASGNDAGGHGVTSRPLLPLPDATDRWPEEDIKAFQERRKERARPGRKATTPAAPLVQIAGVEHMALQISQRLTRSDLRDVLFWYRIQQGKLPVTRPTLLAAVRYCLEKWGLSILVKEIGQLRRGDEVPRDVRIALDSLWPQED